MRFVAASLIAFAATAFAAEPWKNIGGDLAYVGPTYNATFKAGDTIPFEYTFYTPKVVRLNSTTPTNGTAAPSTTTGKTSCHFILLHTNMCSTVPSLEVTSNTDSYYFC
jgi:hypothetical protein